MTKLIQTRRGAVVYAVAAPVLALLLSLLLRVEESNALVYVNPFMDMAAYRPSFLAMVVWMAFSLCTWAVLARWIVRRQIERHGRAGVVALLLVLLMWFPAALGAPVIYVLNLVGLVRGKYPAIPWAKLRWQRLLPLGVLVLVVALMIGLSASDRAQQNAPAPTAEEAFLRQAQSASILAQIPQEDGSVLMISLGACGVVEETADGWVLREAYKSRNEIISNGESAAHAWISRSQTGETDVVVVWKIAFASHDSAKAAVPPRDSAGSEFLLVTQAEGFATSYYYYALVDADAPGYELYLE